MSGKTPKILVIDDETDMLSGFSKLLTALGNEPFPFSECKPALERLGTEEFDLIFCDLLMPDLSGTEMVKEILKITTNTPVIIFTAYGTIERAVDAMRAGAFDFLEKPVDVNKLKLVIEKSLRQKSFFKERNILLEQLDEKYKLDNIIGKSDEMQKIFEMIESVANSDANVLITGESGTGKELIARSIHLHSRRKTKPFVPVNCGSFPENLFEAELFGYEKGAFTGASRRKIGLIEYADKGTFFLDEICELPINLQVKMLRVLQDQKLRRIGGNELIQVDIRIISATNRDMNKALELEQMRQDFFYRINVINIQVPPLKERKSDIKLLADFFLDKFVKKSFKNIKGFDDNVLTSFQNYNWPGNVRELENVIERAVILAKTDSISLKDVPLNITELPSKKNNTMLTDLSLAEAKHKTVYDIETGYLISLLEKHKGNVTKASEEAGMTRRSIHRLLKLHNIDPDKWR